MYSFVLLAGGVGKRMHNEVPKQFLKIAGKPIIVHTMERVDKIDEFDEVVVVCMPQYREKITQLKEQFGLRKTYVFADAGETRQQSVYNGLSMAKQDFVVIHEAARPFVKKREFMELINSEWENVIFTLPINYTVIKGDCSVEGILERSKLRNVQLPQKFNKCLLMEAHKQASLEKKTYTEDASLLYETKGIAAHFIQGTPYNLKITDPIDLSVGEVIYREYFMERR